MKKFLVAAIVLALITWTLLSPVDRQEEENIASTLTAPSLEHPPAVSGVAQGLEIPWGLDFLPGGGIVFTERPGRVRIITPDGRLMPEPLAILPEVAPMGEGGLLGIAVHPNFSSNGFIYLYYTYRVQGGDEPANKVVRYRVAGYEAVFDAVMLDGIPGASIHNGGRIKFGPDGYLYIATGDAARPQLSQDPVSLAGKILRITGNGTIPSDNPFNGSPVYSLGHRNPQGLAWDPQGRLWATEHGPRGMDEINLIQPGKNYGWPVITGSEGAPNMEKPVLHSGADTWAPSGAAFYGDSIFFAGLRGEALYEVAFTDNSPRMGSHLQGKYGRLREVVLGPDNFLYLLTSNLDGRGHPSPGDDRILKVDPSLL